VAKRATVDAKTVRLRVLVLGLSFFAVAVAVAVEPYVAAGHTPNLNRPCTIVGTSGADMLGGTIGGGNGNDIIRAGPGSDRIQGDAGKDVLQGGDGNDWIWARDGTHDHVNGGRGYDHYRADQSIDKKLYVEVVM
jgi:Ca2+-binding RTX toxin-like protein